MNQRKFISLLIPHTYFIHISLSKIYLTLQNNILTMLTYKKKTHLINLATKKKKQNKKCFTCHHPNNEIFIPSSLATQLLTNITLNTHYAHA